MNTGRFIIPVAALCVVMSSTALAKAKVVTSENAAEICFGKRGVQKAPAEFVEESQRALTEEIVGRTHLERERKRCTVSYFAENGEVYVWVGEKIIKGFWRHEEWALCKVLTSYTKKNKPVTYTSIAAAQLMVRVFKDSEDGDVFDLATREAAPGDTDHEQCGSLEEVRQSVMSGADGGAVEDTE